MRRLHEAGLSYQKPEREYYELSEEQREEWIRTEVPKIRRAMRKHRAILYYQDEANVSLTALLGKTWAPRGQTPKQKASGKRAGVAAMSAITKRGRLIFRLHEKRIASAEVIDFLAQMLKHHSRRHLVVVMDQAPPHRSKKQEDSVVYRKPETFTRILPAQILTGLESRRESVEPPEASRTQRPASEDKGRTQGNNR